MRKCCLKQFEAEKEQVLPELGLLVLRWFHLHVSHFTALDGLLLCLQGKPLSEKRVHIHLLAVRALPKDTTHWKPVLSRAMEPLYIVDQLEHAVEIICAEILKQETSDKFSIFKHFL
jgi:hypothetical protein